MVLLALVALLAGVACGPFGGELPAVDALLSSSDLILNLLMISVGMSIGMQRGIARKICQYNVRALVIPLGVTIGSVAGGVACALVTGYSLAESISIAGCMGWYSLGGVTIGALSGGMYGGVAFLSNLMREMLSFCCIPLLARHLSPAVCVAAAGATSEDTTLPMMMKYTDEESVVLSVLNGVICSTLVPVLISLSYQVFGG